MDRGRETNKRFCVRTKERKKRKEKKEMPETTTTNGLESDAMGDAASRKFVGEIAVECREYLVNLLSVEDGPRENFSVEDIAEALAQNVIGGRHELLYEEIIDPLFTRVETPDYAHQMHVCLLYILSCTSGTDGVPADVQPVFKRCLEELAAAYYLEKVYMRYFVRYIMPQRHEFTEALLGPNDTAEFPFMHALRENFYNALFVKRAWGGGDYRVCIIFIRRRKRCELLSDYFGYFDVEYTEVVDLFAIMRLLSRLATTDEARTVTPYLFWDTPVLFSEIILRGGRFSNSSYDLTHFPHPETSKIKSFFRDRGFSIDASDKRVCWDPIDGGGGEVRRALYVFALTYLAACSSGECFDILFPAFVRVFNTIRVEGVETARNIIPESFVEATLREFASHRASFDAENEKALSRMLTGKAAADVSKLETNKKEG